MLISSNYFKFLYWIALILLVWSSFDLTLASTPTVDENNYLRQIQWTRVDLTYAVVGSVASKNQTSRDVVEKTVDEAFSEWQRNSCFRFRRVDGKKEAGWQTADIKVVFSNDKYMNLN